MNKLLIFLTIIFLTSCREKEIKLKEAWISCGRLGEICLIDSVRFENNGKKTVADFSELKLYLKNQLVNQKIIRIKDSEETLKIVYEYNFNSNLGLFSYEIKEIIGISDNAKKVESLRKVLKNDLFWKALPINNSKYEKNEFEDSCIHINPDKLMPFRL